jgi:hypothetical protein
MSKKIISKKIFRRIIILISILLSIKLILELPALFYVFKSAAKLENHKILYIKDHEDNKHEHNFDHDAVYLKIYIDNKEAEELVYEIPNRTYVVKGYIVDGKVILVVSISKPTLRTTHDTIIYTYINGKLIKFKEMIDDEMEKIIKISDHALAIFYFDKFKTIDINGNTKNDKEISLNILDQLPVRKGISHWTKERINSDKKKYLFPQTFSYDEKNNLITIELKDDDAKVVACDLSQDNNCKITDRTTTRGKIKSDHPIIYSDKKTILDLGGGYYNFLPIWYKVISFTRVNPDGTKKVLDRATDYFLAVLGKITVVRNGQMSAKGDYYIYAMNDGALLLDDESDPLNTYVLDVQTGRKKLIEKNAIPLYME